MVLLSLSGWGGLKEGIVLIGSYSKGFALQIKLALAENAI